MRKQVILIMQGNVYPFGQADESPSKTKSNARILVRKKHETRSLQQRNQLLDKIQVVKSINNPYLMKIETVLEQQNSTHVLYEYVPNCLLQKINSLTQNDINQIRDNLLDLAVSLADVGLRADWDSRNIGVNDRQEAKYYLDLDKVGMDKVSSRSKLQREHFKTIMDLFAQFVSSSQKPKQNPRNSGSNSRKTEVTQSQQSSIINARGVLSMENKTQLHNLKQQMQHKATTAKPPPIINNQLQKAQVPLSKQKEQQKQRLQMKNSRTNWKQLDHNEQFMKDFINVLDDKSQNAQSKYVSDEEEEQQHQRDDEQVEGQEEEQEEEEEENYQQKQVYADEHEQEVEYEEDDGEEEEEIIWVSAPDGGEQVLKNSEEEELVWVDHREFADIRQRAEEAIQRSTKVLQAFKLILAKNRKRL